MTLVIHSLQSMARRAMRAYASDLAYHGGLLLALSVLMLTLTLAVVQHLPQVTPADAPQASWEVDPNWWP